MEKTNVMRILDQKKVSYVAYTYECSDFSDGNEIALKLNQDPNMVFKTLLTISGNKKYYVFMVPVNKELDLKKCAKAVNEKSLSMLPLNMLTQVTGYVRGGCSPIGMKKQFMTVIDLSANDFSYIIFSGGKLGYQVQMTIDDLKKVIPLTLFDIKMDVVL